MGDSRRSVATQRWTAARKEIVVTRILKGKVDREAAMAAHGLTAEELDSWIERFQRFGQEGLQARRLQELRA